MLNFKGMRFPIDVILVGSVALLIRQRNSPVRTLSCSSQKHHSCQRRKLVGERHGLDSVDCELALVDYVYLFDAG